MTWDTENDVFNKAKKRAIAFCEENGLSLEKLKTQSFYILGDVALFVQNVKYFGTGLKEDIQSQPKPTLEYDIKNDTIKPARHIYYLSSK